MAKIGRLIHVCVFLLLSAAVRGQQCEENDCSESCLTEQWQRDLCLFYTELKDWQSTALQCGLVVPPIAEPDRSLPAVEQWQQAREEWNLLRDVWEDVAEDAGLTQDTFSGDGSGSDGSGTDSDDRPLEEVWQEELEDWLGHYGNWRDSVRGELPIGSTPQYTTTGPDSTAWFMLLNDWSDDRTIYNETYYDFCSSV